MKDKDINELDQILTKLVYLTGNNATAHSKHQVKVNAKTLLEQYVAKRVRDGRISELKEIIRTSAMGDHAESVLGQRILALERGDK